MKGVWPSSDRLDIDLRDADTFFEFVSLSLAKAEREKIVIMITGAQGDHEN